MLEKIKKGYGDWAKDNRKKAAVVGGIGAAGGLALGGAGLIAGAVAQSTGFTPLVASVAALGIGAKKGFSKLGKSLKSKTNTIADKNLSDKSTPSEVEEGEVTILDKLLDETNNLVKVVKKQEIPPSVERELQQDRDVQHKELVAAFLSLSGPKDDGGDSGDKKKGFMSKIMDFIKSFFKWIGRYFMWIKPLLAFLKLFSRFAIRMLLVFASPAFLAVGAALLIMTNWRTIKKKVVGFINSLKSILNRIPGVDFEMTPIPGEFVDTGPIPGQADDVEATLDTVVVEAEREEPIAEPTIDAFGGEGEDVGKILFTDPEAEEMDTFGLDDDKEDMVDEIRDVLAANLAGELDTELEPEPEPESEPFVPLVTRRRLAEFVTDGSIEQEMYAKTKRNNEAYNLINDFIHGEVKGSRGIAMAKLKEYLAAGYGLDHSYLNDLNKTGRYDVAINKGLDKKYGVGTEDRYAAFEAGIGGVKRYDGQSAPTPPKTPSKTTPQLKNKKKKMPIGMFAAVNEPAQSTGIGWLDDLYAKDASMRYEKAFESQANKIEKLEPKVTVVNNNVSNNTTSKKAAQKTQGAKQTFNVSNNDSVAVFTAK